MRMAFLLMVLVRDKCAWYKTCPGLPYLEEKAGFFVTTAVLAYRPVGELVL